MLAPRPPKNSGLTLIEVLVALMILSVGAFSMLLAGNQALRLSRDVNMEVEKISAADDFAALRRAYERVHPGDNLPREVSTPDCFAVGCTPAELSQIFGART